MVKKVCMETVTAPGCSEKVPNIGACPASCLRDAKPLPPLSESDLDTLKEAAIKESGLDDEAAAKQAREAQGVDTAWVCDPTEEGGTQAPWMQVRLSLISASFFRLRLTHFRLNFRLYVMSPTAGREYSTVPVQCL
jgi:hypothetical protein